MRTLKRSKPFYQTALNNFRKQYGDIDKLTALQITKDNQVCGGEWIDSKGLHHLGHSIDAEYTINIID